MGKLVELTSVAAVLRDHKVSTIEVLVDLEGLPGFHTVDKVMLNGCAIEPAEAEVTQDDLTDDRVVDLTLQFGDLQRCATEDMVRELECSRQPTGYVSE